MSIERGSVGKRVEILLYDLSSLVFKSFLSDAVSVFRYTDSL